MRFYEFARDWEKKAFLDICLLLACCFAASLFGQEPRPPSDQKADSSTGTVYWAATDENLPIPIYTVPGTAGAQGNSLTPRVPLNPLESLSGYTGYQYVWLIPRRVNGTPNGLFGKYRENSTVGVSGEHGFPQEVVLAPTLEEVMADRSQLPHEEEEKQYLKLFGQYHSESGIGQSEFEARNYLKPLERYLSESHLGQSTFEARKYLKLLEQYHSVGQNAFEGGPDPNTSRILKVSPVEKRTLVEPEPWWIKFLREVRE